MSSFSTLSHVHFNSIKVRLELLYRVEGAMLNNNFNSIKVRLELSWGAFLISWVQSFQFHKGTIRTAKKTIKQQYEEYFNSIKVRLELVYTYTSHLLGDFNSIKVRLERTTIIKRFTADDISIP